MQDMSVVRKLVPETATTVPTAPKLGVNVIDGTVGTVNATDDTRPLGKLVTCTMYVPAAAVGETINLAATTPPLIVQIGEDTKPGGEEPSVQLVSVLGKFLPVTKTVVPLGAELGVTVRAPVTVKVAEAGGLTPPAPTTVTRYGPAAGEATVVKLAVRVPSGLTLQLEVAARPDGVVEKLPHGPTSPG
jgi:hypothetical protein